MKAKYKIGTLVKYNHPEAEEDFMEEIVGVIHMATDISYMLADKQVVSETKVLAAYAKIEDKPAKPNAAPKKRGPRKKKEAAIAGTVTTDANVLQ